jgi:type I restriction enzyme, S subunit
MKMREIPFTDLLSHIADNRGRTCPTAPSGRPLIATNCISNNDLYPSYETERYVSDETYRTWFRAHPLPGDIIFVCKGSPGRVALAPDPVDFCIAQDMVAVRADDSRVYPKYLFAALRSQVVQDRINNMHVGTLIPHFKKGDFDKLQIPLPDRNVQEFIGDTYFELSEKIEQNRRTGRALEGLARATFKAWFVDFEPVKAKAAGQTSFPGMPPAAFAALPDRLTDSPIGLVPQGWEVKPLAEAFDINPPRRLSKGQDAPYLDMKNMPTDGHAPDTWERRPHGSGMRFINGDTLVARITPCLENGKTAYVDFLNDGDVAWGSTEYIVLRPTPPLPEIYAYCLARTPEFREFAIQNMTGTSGRQRVAVAALEHYQVAVPDAVTAAAFGEFARPLFKCIRAGKAESSKLASLRDYLLPLLLSGAVRVKSKGAS